MTEKGRTAEHDARGGRICTAEGEERETGLRGEEIIRYLFGDQTIVLW